MFRLFYKNPKEQELPFSPLPLLPEGKHILDTGSPGLLHPQRRVDSLWFGDSVEMKEQRRPGQTSGPADSSRKCRQLDLVGKMGLYLKEGILY